MLRSIGQDCSGVTMLAVFVPTFCRLRIMGRIVMLSQSSYRITFLIQQYSSPNKSIIHSRSCSLDKYINIYMIYIYILYVIYLYYMSYIHMIYNKIYYIKALFSSNKLGRVNKLCIYCRFKVSNNTIHKT